MAAKRSAAYALTVSSIPSRVRPSSVAADEQALGDEPVERVDAGAGDRLGRLDSGAAGKHREAREARFLVGAEQLVAPVDRGPQSLLAGGRVPRRGAESAKRAVQAFCDLCR